MRKAKELYRRFTAWLARQVAWLVRGGQSYEDIIRPVASIRRELDDFAAEQRDRAGDERREAELLRERACERDAQADRAERTAARISNLLEG